MTRKRVVSVAVASCLSLAVAAFASQTMEGELEARGEIVGASIQAFTITLEETGEDGEPGAVRTFVITESTELTSEGGSIELADIRPGSLATVRYLMDYGNSVATWVEVAAPATD